MSASGVGVAGWKIARLQGSETSTAKVLSTEVASTLALIVTE